MRSIAACGYGAAAAAFVGFAIWGSLFPFDFHRVSLGAAVGLFWSTFPDPPDPLSLSDIISNFLLFVPIGLFLAATVDRSTCVGSGPSRTRSRRSAAATRAFFVVSSGIVLSAALELGQAFISWRTPSALDVVAESLGTVIGVTLWRALCAELDRAVESAVILWRRSTATERMLIVYGIAFSGMWLLPFDITLRPIEIADKFYHHRLLLPFMPSPDRAAPGRLAALFVMAVPLGLAAVICGCRPGVRRSVARGMVIGAAWLVCLELLQAMVFSRTTDATELVLSSPGVALGAIVARRAGRHPNVTLTVDSVAPLLAAASWLAALALFEWWPLNFVPHVDDAWTATIVWSRAPFRAPASFADLVPGAAIGAAAGIVLRPRLHDEFFRLQFLVSIAAIGALFLTLEVGRVALVDGRPTLLSVFVKTAAAGVGFALGCPRADAVARLDQSHSS